MLIEALYSQLVRTNMQSISISYVYSFSFILHMGFTTLNFVKTT